LQKKAPVPDRIATEWVRSPVFIASQEEINLMIDEKESIRAMSRLGSREQAKMAADLRLAARALKVKVHAERSKLRTYRPGLEGLSAPLRSEIVAFMERLAHYRRFQTAATVWRAVARSEDAQSR